jgi:hypothetical protein
MSNHSRRTILAGIAASPALAAPALALSALGPDPIFAAIKRHRAAAEAHTASVDEQAELETAAWAEQAETVGLASFKPLPKDGPRWLDFERRSKVIYDQLKEERRHLFEAPMSIAGLVALIEYMEEQRLAGNGDWDDAWSLPAEDEMLSALVGTMTAAKVLEQVEVAEQVRPGAGQAAVAGFVIVIAVPPPPPPSDPASSCLRIIDAGHMPPDQGGNDGQQ